MTSNQNKASNKRIAIAQGVKLSFHNQNRICFGENPNIKYLKIYETEPTDK